MNNKITKNFGKTQVTYHCTIGGKDLVDYIGYNKNITVYESMYSSIPSSKEIFIVRLITKKEDIDTNAIYDIYKDGINSCNLYIDKCDTICKDKQNIIDKLKLHRLGKYTGLDIKNYLLSCENSNNICTGQMSTGYNFEVDTIKEQSLYNVYEDNNHILYVFEQNTIPITQNANPNSTEHGIDSECNEVCDENSRIIFAKNGDVYTGKQWREYAIANKDDCIEASYLYNSYFKGNITMHIFDDKKYSIKVNTTNGIYVILIPTDERIRRYFNPEYKVKLSDEYYVPFDISESQLFEDILDWMLYCNTEYTRAPESEKNKYFLGYVFYRKHRKTLVNFKPERYYFIKIQDIEYLISHNDYSLDHAFCICSDLNKKKYERSTTEYEGIEFSKQGTRNSNNKEKRTIDYTDDDISEYTSKIGLDSDFKEALSGLFDYLKNKK